jgi:hypothetical protein
MLGNKGIPPMLGGRGARVQSQQTSGKKEWEEAGKMDEEEWARKRAEDEELGKVGGEGGGIDQKPLSPSSVLHPHHKHPIHPGRTKELI